VKSILHKSEILNKFKIFPILTGDGFWRVSADTKACGSPLSLAFWLTVGIIPYFDSKIN
jgi:hypothetical protein